MRKKDLLNRQKVLYHQLELMVLYRDEFIEKLKGVKGYEERMNHVLDELILLREQIEAMPD